MTIPSIKTQIQGLLVLTLLPLLLYFNALQGSFQFDDRNLIDREWIADLSQFQKSVHIGQYENRPILLWTLALNNTLHKNKVFGFHLLNLMLHVFVCVLIFVILTQTQNLFAPPEGERKPPYLLPACLPALLFAVHPLNTDSVTYISSRSTLLATFFYLLTLYAFLKIFSSHQRQWPVRAIFGLTTLTGLYLAIASKLIAVTLPLILVLWFWLYIRPHRFPGLRSRLFAKKMIPVYGGVLLVVLTAVFFLGPGILYAPKDQGLELFGRIPYLLVEIKVIVFYYLKLFFIPVNLNVDVGFPFSTFTTDLWGFIAVLVIGALVFLALKTKNPWFKGGVLWFFITLLPTSSIVPLSDLAVEHRMYLPMSLGLCLAIGGGVYKFSTHGRIRLLVTLIALFGLLTLSRNFIWTDEIRLWQDAATKNPHSPRTHNNLGKAHYEKGRLEQALAHFLKANENTEQRLARQYNLADPQKVLARQARKNQIDLDGKADDSYSIVADLAEPHYNLASVYLDLGDFKKAGQEYQTALRLNPDYFDALFGLGSVYARTGRGEQALDFFRQSIEKRKSVTGKKDYPLARLNIGELLGHAGRFEEAVRELKLAIAGDPSMVLGYYNLGLAYLMTGKLEQAEQALTICLTLDNRFEPALFNLARVTQAMGLWALSTRQFEQFLSVKGADSGAFFQIGWNHQQAGAWDKARKSYEKALQLNPPYKLQEKISRLLEDLS
jgi:tetratricopeptide (TPR) repeat protein